MQASSAEQPVVATAGPAAAVDCSAADSDIKPTTVTQSGKSDAVDRTSTVDIQSTDPASTASACRRHTEASAVVRHKACRSALWIAFVSGEQGEITGLLVQYWKLSLHYYEPILQVKQICLCLTGFTSLCLDAYVFLCSLVFHCMHVVLL